MTSQLTLTGAGPSGPGLDWAVTFNATTTNINCGSDGDIDDIQDDAFTIEAWVRADGYGEGNIGFITEKGTTTATGWDFYIRDVSGFRATVRCATTNAESVSGLDEFTADGLWHHLVMFFDDAGDRKIYLANDGVWVASYVTQAAGVDAIISDAATNLTIGARSDGARTWDGAIGWVRISNNDRYNHGVNFTPSHIFPDDDANTLASWNMNEGTGTDIANTGNQAGGGSGASNRDGTLSNGAWEKTFPLS